MMVGRSVNCTYFKSGLMQPRWRCHHGYAAISNYQVASAEGTVFVYEEAVKFHFRKLQMLNLLRLSEKFAETT